MNTDRFLCKAKNIEEYSKGKWVIGYYFRQSKLTRIMADIKLNQKNKLHGIYDIDPNTLCQCTGKKLKNNYDDDNGILLYEGDKVKAAYGFYYEGAFIDGEVNGVVTWFDSAFCVKANRPGERAVMVCDLTIGEVIGNIHDDIDVSKKD